MAGGSRSEKGKKGPEKKLPMLSTVKIKKTMNIDSFY